jgi:hypothetical protein
MLVVLPAPFGPSKPKISPGYTSNETSSTARTEPNDFPRWETLTVGEVIANLPYEIICQDYTTDIRMFPARDLSAIRHSAELDRIIADASSR